MQLYLGYSERLRQEEHPHSSFKLATKTTLAGVQKVAQNISGAGSVRMNS